MDSPNEVICPACGREALVLRRPKYDGFRKTGEERACASCGHVFAEEEAVAAPARAAPKVFDDDDRPQAVKVFAEGESSRICRHCAHYVVNPFRQWCGLHRKEVEATDTCGRFAPRPPPKTLSPPP